MSIRNTLIRAHWILSTQFGIEPRKVFRSLRGLPRYVRDFFRYRANYIGRIELVPCLHDWYEEGGSTKNEYFWQDLFVARMIFAANPVKHVDVGSRVDGFVAHVASFREIEVFDIRSITSAIPGVVFKQADLMNPTADIANYCDSLSCLHALEHFGLGRYGDPIDPKGHESGLRNMTNILRAGGIFYLSVPVGVERVEFNANRVFNPHTIVTIARSSGLTLRTFSLFTPDNGLVEVGTTHEALSAAGNNRYGLGIFTFVKDGAR
jgi:SAM-dependent methyltransferase